MKIYYNIIHQIVHDEPRIIVKLTSEFNNNNKRNPKKVIKKFNHPLNKIERWCHENIGPIDEWQERIGGFTITGKGWANHYDNETPFIVFDETVSKEAMTLFALRWS